MPISPQARPYLDALPSAGGKRAVVTGGNAGLGRETVRYLAHKGAAVVIAARALAKAEEARADVLRDVPAADIAIEQLDLSLLSSVRSAAARLGEQPIDLLICNAGIMALARSQTEDGFEAQLGVNHLGHFALVGRLWEALNVRPGARIVSVTSGAGFNASIDFDDLMGERRYDRWRAYGQSKLANMLFTLGLARRLSDRGGVPPASARSSQAATPASDVRPSGTWPTRAPRWSSPPATSPKLRRLELTSNAMCRQRTSRSSNSTSPP